MALVPCQECGKEMSAEALTCPGCGKPNKAATDGAQNNRQAVGCALVLLGIVIALLFWPILGGILALTGIIIAALNTRFA